MKTKLIFVPTVFFKQGDVIDGGEDPIQIQYYAKAIALEQNGQSILIHKEYINDLFNAIKKHLPDARKRLAEM